MVEYRGERGIPKACRPNLNATKLLYEKGFLSDPIFSEDELIAASVNPRDNPATELHQTEGPS